MFHVEHPAQNQRLRVPRGTVFRCFPRIAQEIREILGCAIPPRKLLSESHRFLPTTWHASSLSPTRRAAWVRPPLPSTWLPPLPPPRSPRSWWTATRNPTPPAASASSATPAGSPP